jgi:hypothetical protein
LPRAKRRFPSLKVQNAKPRLGRKFLKVFFASESLLKDDWESAWFVKSTTTVMRAMPIVYVSFMTVSDRPTRSTIYARKGIID